MMKIIMILSLIVGPIHAQQPTKSTAPEEYKKFSPEEYSSIQSYLEPFIFRGNDLRNPFKPPEINIPLVPGELYGPFLPLQSFRLENLRVKGLFWDIKKPTALIEAPQKQLHRVGIKEYIGENFGYIASIREKEIVVIQTLEEDNTIVFGYDIQLVNEDYTLGKVLEYVMYSKHFGKALTYCGFRKPHPHRSESYLRLGFKTEVGKAEVATYLTSAAAAAIVVFDRIAGEFDTR